MTLMKWLDHFIKTGMPAGFVIDGGTCSIWRAGERSGVGDKSDKPIGVLHGHVNGFDTIWAANGGVVAKSSNIRARGILD